MIGNIAARRYAKALFALGKKSGAAELKTYGSALAQIQAAMAASPELSRVFCDPVFTVEEKKKVITALAKKLKISGTALNFLRLLADNDRLADLPAVVAVYGALVDAEEGVMRGELVTAVPLDEQKQAEVNKFLRKKTRKTPALVFSVEPEIIGGVVLKLGDLAYDASLRGQLSILKDSIKKGV